MKHIRVSFNSKEIYVSRSECFKATFSFKLVVACAFEDDPHNTYLKILDRYFIGLADVNWLSSLLAWSSNE